MNTTQVVIGGVQITVGTAGILLPDPATTGAGAVLVADGMRRIGDGSKD